MTICAIHQPNFFPWTGYFDKIRKADIFIFLDEVAYPKSGSGSGSWCNRVRLLNNGKQAWAGLPIKKESGVQLIKDVCFFNQEYHVKKLLKFLEHNYSKGAAGKTMMKHMEYLLNFPSSSLADFNINAITFLSEYMGFKTRFIRQSQLQHSLQSTALLIELLIEVGADTYLCGNGCSSYQEDALFANHSIKLVYQNYDPHSNQWIRVTNTDEAGLSIINHLFHDTFNASLTSGNYE